MTVLRVCFNKICINLKNLEPVLTYFICQRGRTKTNQSCNGQNNIGTFVKAILREGAGAIKAVKVVGE